MKIKIAIWILLKVWTSFEEIDFKRLPCPTSLVPPWISQDFLGRVPFGSAFTRMSFLDGSHSGKGTKLIEHGKIISSWSEKSSSFTVVVKFSPPGISQRFLGRVPFGSAFTRMSFLDGSNSWRTKLDNHCKWVCTLFQKKTFFCYRVWTYLT